MRCLQNLLKSSGRFADDNWQRRVGNCHRQARVFSARVALLAYGLWLPAAVLAHGGVVMEVDQCVIDIGLFRAHFTIYQPQTRASEEFCEDVPDLGETIFVMDYLHDSLRRMPVDFRIIRDVNDRRNYARWQDVEALDDLEAATVFHQPPRIEPGGSLTARHDFDEKGWYIGVVTTQHPTLDKQYKAVFGFHVGGQGLGYWPLLLLLAVLVQVHFWISGGGIKRRRERAASSRPGASL
jgi:hypothetical protein